MDVGPRGQTCQVKNPCLPFTPYHALNTNLCNILCISLYAPPIVVCHVPIFFFLIIF